MPAPLLFPLVSLVPQIFEVMAEAIKVRADSNMFIGLSGCAVYGNVEKTETRMEDLVNCFLAEKEAVGEKTCIHVGVILDNFEYPVNVRVKQGLSVVARDELLCIGKQFFIDAIKNCRIQILSFAKQLLARTLNTAQIAARRGFKLYGPWA